MAPQHPALDPTRRSPAALSRRALFLGTAGTAAAAAAAAAPPATAAPGRGPQPRRNRSFVGVQGVHLTVDGAPWRFAGTNCYYLHQKSHYMIDSVLNDAAAMGLRVVRAWAFADGTERTEKALQPEPFVYDEAAFDSLDHTVARAGELGLRLVLPLTNNWKDYGGMPQYLQWFRGLDLAAAEDEANHDLFYTDPEIERCFRAWVRHLLTRRNRYTGLRYTDDPTVMTWELANEPRCRSDKSGRTLLAWADRTSRYVKKLAKDQLVAVGDEGFLGIPDHPEYPYSAYEGARWADLTNLPAVDYGTLHLYPDYWMGGLTKAQRIEWGTRYIRDHVDHPAVAKPVVLEEYGITEVTDQAFAAWTAAVEDGGNGDQFWILTGREDSGALYPDYDGHRVVYPSPTADLLSAHARRMAQNPAGSR
ncbi:hypothetical protein NUM3379_00340 [Kineococcus sp. NUM-3379]